MGPSSRGSGGEEPITVIPPTLPETDKMVGKRGSSLTALSVLELEGLSGTTGAGTINLSGSRVAGVASMFKAG